MLALVEGNSWGWGSPQIIALFAFAAIALAAFVLDRARTAESPMVDFRLFRSRTFLGANIVAFIVSFAMLAMFFFIALYMQNIRGYSPLEAGVRFLPSTLVIIVIGPIAGRLSDRIGPRPLMIGRPAARRRLAVLAELPRRRHAPTATSPAASSLMGVGMGLVMSPMSTAAMNAVDRSKAGVASGVLSMIRMVGGTFGVAVTGALISAIGRSKLDDAAAPAATAEQIDRLDRRARLGRRPRPARPSRPTPSSRPSSTRSTRACELGAPSR